MGQHELVIIFLTFDKSSPTENAAVLAERRNVSRNTRHPEHLALSMETLNF